MTVLNSRPVNFRNRFISFCNGIRHLLAVCRHDKNASAGIDDFSVPDACTRMEHNRAVFFRIFNSGDFKSLSERSGIPFGSHYDTDGRLFAPFHIDFGNPALRGFHENIGKTAFESGKNRLGFRIAETDIELKHLRTVFRNHDSCVDNAAVVKFFLPDAFQKTLKHFFINLFHQRIRDDRGRGVSAHSARIGPLVIVQETFVILRRNQRNYRFAIGQRENRRFLADQKFFDDDDTSRCPERSAEALLDRILRVFPAGGDNDAFSGGESIRFDNDAAPCVIFFADIFQSAFLVSKTGISGGRNAVFDHELLGEILAALQPGGIF